MNAHLAVVARFAEQPQTPLAASRRGAVGRQLAPSSLTLLP